MALKEDSSPPLQPRTWGWWILVGVAWLAFRMSSIHTARLWGIRISKLVKYLVAPRLNVIRTNLALAFPDMDAAERERLTQRNLEETGAGYLESAYVLLCGSRQVLANCEVRGRDVLEEALREGKNILLIGAHYTCLESCGCVMGHDVAVDIVHRHQNAVVPNYLILRHRRRSYAGVIHRDDRAGLVKALADKSRQRVIWLSPDQDMGHQRSVFAPFLGVEQAATLKATSKIASRYDMKAVFIEFSYEESNRKWIIHYRPIEAFPSNDQVADATTVNRVIGESAQRNPSQYYWVHRRFKSLPDGSVRQY